MSRALRSMERLRNDALQTRDPGVWGWRDGSRLSGAPLKKRCTASGTREVDDAAGLIDPFGVTNRARITRNLFAGNPDALAFTIAPHLQIINYRGRFWGIAGI